MRTQTILYVVLFTMGSLLAQAQQQVETLAVSLEEAINIGIQNNLTLKDQAIDVAIAKSQVQQTLAQGLPQIFGSFDYQFTIANAFASRTTGGSGEAAPPSPVPGDYASFENNPANNAYGQERIDDILALSGASIGSFFNNIGDAFASKHAGNFGVSVSQQLFDGVYLLGIQAAQVYVDLAEVQTLTTDRDINKDVEKAYYGALITQENIDIIDRNIETISKLLNDTKATYDAGFVEQLDVDRLQLSLSVLENQRKRLEKINEFNYNVFKNTINVPLNTVIELTESIETFEKIATSEETLQQVYTPEAWPEFQVLDAQEQISLLNKKRYEKGNLPTVDLILNGTYGYQGNDFIFSNGLKQWYPNAIAGISVNFPIFDGNLRRNQVKQAQLELDKVDLSREILQTNIDIQIQNSLTAFLNFRADLENQKETIALAEKIYNTSEIKYREGVGSSVELNQAEQDLYQAQQSYMSTLYDLLIAKVNLEQALGK